MTALLPIVVAVVLLGLLARFRAIYPEKALVRLAIVPALLGALLVVDDRFAYPILVLDGLIFAFAAFDLLSLPRPQSILAERETGRVASLQRPNETTLTIVNKSANAIEVDLKDDLPAEFIAEPKAFRLELPASSRAFLHYRFTPNQRGAYRQHCVHLRLKSGRKLWKRMVQAPADSKIDVYPNLRQVEEFGLMARTNRLSLLGVRRSRIVGQDHEFERLRDYTQDDNFRHIDWRSTARRQKLTVKDFQSSHNQRVVFMLDCGRMMTNQSGELSLLDYSLNALLLLSFVALQQGDAVGLLAFSDSIHGYVPPEGGKRQMNRIMHAVFDRFPRLVESRYDEAFLHLAKECRKRSLVILATNLIDEVNALQVKSHLCNLVGRHLPLGVMLRDRRLFAELQQAEEPGDGIYRAGAAADILLWRRQVIRDLQFQGVNMLDLFPEEMTAGVINRYLEIKARKLL